MTTRIPVRTVDNADYLGAVREIVQQGEQVSVTLSGNSMSPFLIHGRDRIVIAPITEPLRRGDMAIFQRRDGKYIMHRICRIRRGKQGQEQYYFVGDAQKVIEGPIQRDQIFGVIPQVFRKGRWIQKGDFWWDFFAEVWLRIIPARGIAIKGYRRYKQLRTIVFKQ
ncbi:MAG: S24/S26 family peptidase [Butyricicoccaceae bacterium]